MILFGVAPLLRNISASERSPANINFTLVSSSLSDLDLLFYRNHSRYEAETLTSTSRFKNMSLW